MSQKSLALRALIWLFLAHQIAFFCLSWSPTSISVFGVTMHLAPAGMGFEEARNLASEPRLWGMVLAIPATWAMAHGIWRLDLLLRLTAGKAMFSLNSIGHLRAFAGATALSTALSIVEVPVRGLLFHYALGVPREPIKVGVSSSEVLLVLVCIMFYFVGGLMHEARRIAQENESFV